MFLTNSVDLSFGDGLDFGVEVPDNPTITAIYSASMALAKKEEIMPDDFCQMAELVSPKVVKKPDTWEQLPDVTKSRLLFEIAKFLVHESLSIPDLKKK